MVADREPLMAKAKKTEAHAVILAGGRGTRFWPRSRLRTPKQLLNIVGSDSMLVETVRRLAPDFPPSRIWVVTNKEQVEAVRKQLRRVPGGQILAEPVGRNTAAAIGLAAVHLARRSPNALMAVLPADHFIRDAARYRKIVRAALEVAKRGPNLVVLGIPPTRPETGYGYIERGAEMQQAQGEPVYPVQRFTEKPKMELAAEYVESGQYDWNAGMFFWRVDTFLDCLENYLPATRAALEQIAASIGTRKYSRTLARIYPKLENISVDYAVMERATQTNTAGDVRVFVLPADVGWSDIGSWAAVYELMTRQLGGNVISGDGYARDAEGNYVWAPGKFVAVLGVKDLVVVETPDALLICPRDRAQDVGKIVDWLRQNGRARLV